MFIIKYIYIYIYIHYNQIMFLRKNAKNEFYLRSVWSQEMGVQKN